MPAGFIAAFPRVRGSGVKCHPAKALEIHLAPGMGVLARQYVFSALLDQVPLHIPGGQPGDAGHKGHGGSVVHAVAVHAVEHEPADKIFPLRHVTGIKGIPAVLAQVIPYGQRRFIGGRAAPDDLLGKLVHAHIHAGGHVPVDQYDERPVIVLIVFRGVYRVGDPGFVRVFPVIESIRVSAFQPAGSEHLSYVVVVDFQPALDAAGAVGGIHRPVQVVPENIHRRGPELETGFFGAFVQVKRLLVLAAVQQSLYSGQHVPADLTRLVRVAFVHPRPAVVGIAYRAPQVELAFGSHFQHFVAAGIGGAAEGLVAGAPAV